MILNSIIVLFVLLSAGPVNVYPNPLISVQLEGGKYLTDQCQVVSIILESLWPTLLLYPVEGLMIGIFISLVAYDRMVHNKQLLSHEKLGISLSIIDKAQTPMTLIQHLLEDITSDNIPEAVADKVKRALGHTNYVISCHKNVIALNKMKEEIDSGFSTTEFELYTYLNLVTNQCRAYANMHRVQLNVSKNFTYFNCRVNETAMTAALQCLLNKIIDITPCDGCINIGVSRLSNRWSLRISNCLKCEGNDKRMFTLISGLTLVHCCGSLRFIRKIIRLHGGKLVGSSRGRIVTFQITVPISCTCNMTEHPVAENCAEKSCKVIRSNGEGEIDDIKLSLESDKAPSVLLVMADKELSEYLNEVLSHSFRITTLEEPERFLSFSSQAVPDAIIIDETVNGIYGDELCSQIKSDINMSNIPVVLLISSDDNESYLAHIHCGADKLELRMVNICKLKADIRILIARHTSRREHIKRLLAKSSSTVIPKIAMTDDDNIRFMNKVQELLEKNLFERKYTIKMLGEDMGMSRTKFYSKMTEIIGKAPEDYVLAFKMDKARILLAAQRYSITEVATILGYCDAKYFGKKFKEFYHVPPSKYIENAIG